MHRLFGRPSSEPLSVRPATVSDRGALTRLTEHARRTHFHLDWWSLDDWLADPSSNAWIALTGARIAGALIAPVQDVPVAWIRLVAVADHVSVRAALNVLLSAAMLSLRMAGIGSLACLAYPDWLAELLPGLGFAPLTDVAHYRKDDRDISETGATGVRVRPATHADLPAILAIDRAAFDPIWWHTLDSLARVQRDAAQFVVAERGDRVLGHIFSDVYSGRGHIIRLAVHPDEQGRGIGARLLSEALMYLLAAGAHPITLNTQTNNYASQSLYRRFRFVPTGESTAVMLRSLSKM